MARPKKYVEDMVARFAEGTFERIKSVLAKDEDRADFVRDAVEKELRRRERKGPTRTPGAAAVKPSTALYPGGGEDVS